jgi:hypothetical protein
MFAKLKWLDWLPKWLKAIFRRPFQLSPKHHLKPHDLGTIFGAKDQKNASPWRAAWA